MLGRVNFRFELKDINKWKKTAGLYNKSLTEFFKDAADFYIKYQGKTTVFNQSEYTESVKRYEEGFIKITKQNELLLTKLNEANQEVKNAKEEKENIQSISVELAAMRGLLQKLDASTNTSTIKALEAIPKISSAFEKFQETISNYVGRGGK